VELDLVIGLVLGLGLFMAFGIGANDVANAMGTSVGSKAITLVQAIMIAAVFEFLGAYLVGSHVTETIRKGILDLDLVRADPTPGVWGMLAALTGAATWLVTASRMGWPVSTTHSIIGAVAGFGVVAYGVDGVEWAKLAPIAASWVISPLLAGTFAFVVISFLRRTILDTEDPLARLRRWGPVHIFTVVGVMSLLTLYKGLKSQGLDLTFLEAMGISCALGAVVAAVGGYLIARIEAEAGENLDFHYATVERTFGVLMILTSCAVAFAHGSNDVANAIGPVAYVISVHGTGTIAESVPVSSNLLLLGAVGIVVGLAVMGYRVMLTIGEKITALTPSGGYSAQLAAAVTIVLASRLGLPVSTTHVLVGAVLGVGLARGVEALDYRVVGKIIVSWIVTLPAGAGLAIFFYYFYRGLLS